MIFHSYRFKFKPLSNYLHKNMVWYEKTGVLYTFFYFLQKIMVSLCENSEGTLKTSQYPRPLHPSRIVCVKLCSLFHGQDYTRKVRKIRHKLHMEVKTRRYTYVLNCRIQETLFFQLTRILQNLLRIVPYQSDYLPCLCKSSVNRV